MFTGILVKPKFGMLQNYFCRNSKLLVDVDNIFSHALQNNYSFDSYESFPLFFRPITRDTFNCIRETIFENFCIVIFYVDYGLLW